MVGFGTSSAFRGWVRVRVLGYCFGVRGRKVKSITTCNLPDVAWPAAQRSPLRGVLIFITEDETPSTDDIRLPFSLGEKR